MKLSCAAVAQWLPVILDGERAPVDAEHIAEHVAECPRCRDLERDLRGMRAAFARTAVPPALPPGLRDQVMRATARPSRWAAGVAAALAASMLLSLDGGQVEISSLAEAAALHHRTVLAGTTPLDVTSSRPAEVTAWFAGRVSFPLELPPTGAFALAGGRIIEAGGSLAAYLLYGSGRDAVSLAIAPAAGAPEPLPGERYRGLDFHFARSEDLEIITWRDRGLSYALVSSLPDQGRASCQVCHTQESGLRDVADFHSAR